MTRLSRAGGTRKKPVRYASQEANSGTLGAALRAHKKGLIAEALARYEARLSEVPECLDAWMNVGALHAQAGRALEATNAFEAAASLAPSDGRVFRDIALGLKTIGRLEDAMRVMDQSVAWAPELVGSWLHLALLRLEVADRDAAIGAAEAAVRLQPTDASAHFVLARCVFDMNDPGPALKALGCAKNTPGGHPEAEVFESLIRSHREYDDVRADVAGDQATPLATTTAHDADPSRVVHRLSDLEDAAVHVRQCMPNAWLFSSTRETLRYAAEVAPANGATVELGVFHGVSLRWLAQYRPPPVHGFDSFLGLPSGWNKVPEGRFTTAGRPPEGISARFWVGSFEQQLPRYVAQHPEPIALLHVDSDLYESARCGLQHLSPRLVPGSVIVFDEYLGHRGWRQDEHRAFMEAVAANGWVYEALAVNPFTGQAVFRLVG